MNLNKKMHCVQIISNVLFCLLYIHFSFSVAKIDERLQLLHTVIFIDSSFCHMCVYTVIPSALYFIAILNI